MNQPNKRGKNTRNKSLWKIRMKTQINNWRKELSIIAETGTGYNNGKFNGKERNIF
jgi:hypothetical protein